MFFLIFSFQKKQNAPAKSDRENWMKKRDFYCIEKFDDGANFTNFKNLNMRRIRIIVIRIRLILAIKKVYFMTTFGKFF